jgi:hypothetical protein
MVSCTSRSFGVLVSTYNPCRNTCYSNLRRSRLDFTMLDATAMSDLTLLNILTKELHLRTAKHSLQNEDICRMAALRIVTTSHHCYLQGQVQAAISGSQWQGLLLEGSTRYLDIVQ